MLVSASDYEVRCFFEVVNIGAAYVAHHASKGTRTADGKFN